MTEPEHADPKPAASGKSRSGRFRTIKEIFIRLWALAILVVVIGIAWLALDYMVDYVFSPSEVPPRILEWQSKLDPRMLHADTAQTAKMDAPRAPLGHYHGVDEWYEPAAYLSCTIGGCHSPLPHQKRKEIRAFANLHATFMTCQMCHEKNVGPGMETVWLDPATGATRQDPPALLQLLNLLESTDQPEDRQAFTHQVVSLLDQSLAQTRNEPLLEHLNLLLRTTHPGSPVWTQTLRDLRRELPQHARGEYGARLAPAAGGRDYATFHQEIKDLANGYFSGQSDDGRTELKNRIHERVNPEPSGCLACHGGEPARMDFVKAGYTQQRATSLRNVEIANLMSRLLEGRPFHLPRIMLPGAAPSNGSQE